MGSTLSSLRGKSLSPAKGTWSQRLKDTLVVELTTAGSFDPASRHVIESELTDSKDDAAIRTCTGRVAARPTVKRFGKLVYDKELAANAGWESSFMGAVAMPAAINRCGALYKALVGSWSTTLSFDALS